MGRGRRLRHLPIGCGARATSRFEAPPGGRGRRCSRRQGVPPRPDASRRPCPHTAPPAGPSEAAAGGQTAAPQPLDRPGVVYPPGPLGLSSPVRGVRLSHWCPKQLCLRGLGPWEPIGPSSLARQKHLVRGQLLGGSHDTAAGVVRHGTARYGTVRGHYGWHRAQQTRTPSQCSEGAHPASHLPLETAPSRARPSVFAPPVPPPCPADCHISGWGPGPAGGCAPPLLAGTKARWRMCSGGEIGPGGGLGPACDLHTVQVFTARGAAGPAARGRHPRPPRLSPAGRGGGCARCRGSPPWGCPGIPDPQPPACPQPWAPAELPARDLPQSVGFPRQPGPRSQVHKSAKSFQYSDGLMEKKKRKVQAKNSKH
ncbi:transcription initiation factor TFIID subunit 4-like [Onychostruthus taczanowskii]|uniref:transcription initiation factor TFIID subunit 4-like n=1 Tax=Onychostruthus taczanowskii TaxID=356909 RepID=UPI001B80AE19|nr:transcription initiation factor TFIID subunit 4-like [Onychostruthus taczanowskii]